MTNKTQRPKRQRMGDRLVNPDAVAAEIRIDHAVAPFDRKSREMDRKWGIDRLPELVSPETAGKFGNAIGKLNAAISSADYEECIKQVGSCIRGLEFMDREAEAAGCEKSKPEVWEYDLDDFHFAIIPDNAHWQVLADQRPGLRFFTMREAAVALRAYADNPHVAAVKKFFPDAEVVKVSPRIDTKEPIPF